MKNCFRASLFVARCLAKILQIPVFLAGLLWELEVIQVKKTPVFARHVLSLSKKNISKSSVFYAFTQKHCK